MKFAHIVCAGVWLLAGSAAAQQGDKAIQKTTISLGTATPGGGFPLYGNAFAEVMNAADPTLEITPRNTKGSNENIPLLEAGKLDIALVAGEPAYQAFMGIGRRCNALEDPDRDLFVARHVRGARRQPLQDHPRPRRPTDRVRRQGLGLPIMSRYVLDGLGLKQDEDFKSIYLDHAGDGPAMVLDGRAAALVGRRHRLARLRRDRVKPRAARASSRLTRPRSRRSGPSTVS